VSKIFNDAVLDLAANAPQTVRSGTIVVISTIPAESGQDEEQIPLDKNEPYTSTVYASQFSLRTPTPFAGSAWPPGLLSVSYHLSGAVLQTKDRLFVQMPGVEMNILPNTIGPSGPEDTIPALLSEKDPKTGQVIGFTDEDLNPVNFLSVSDPSDYQTAYGVPDVLFWSPAITSTEEILGLEQELQNDQIDSAVPTGTAVQGGYSWQGSGSMAPYLTATNPDAVAEESTWDFRSGIAFGVAVGAGVAFVQELPDVIHPTRLRLKRRPKRS